MKSNQKQRIHKHIINKSSKSLTLPHTERNFKFPFSFPGTKQPAIISTPDLESIGLQSISSPTMHFYSVWPTGGLPQFGLFNCNYIFFTLLLSFIFVFGPKVSPLQIVYHWFLFWVFCLFIDISNFLRHHFLDFLHAFLWFSELFKNHLKYFFQYVHNLLFL